MLLHVQKKKKKQKGRKNSMHKLMIFLSLFVVYVGVYVAGANRWKWTIVRLSIVATGLVLFYLILQEVRERTGADIVCSVSFYTLLEFLFTNFTYEAIKFFFFFFLSTSIELGMCSNKIQQNGAKDKSTGCTSFCTVVDTCSLILRKIWLWIWFFFFF